MPDKKRYPCVLLFGGPGSGKGTQGAVLGALPNMVHLAMGDIFRGLDKKSNIGKEFLSYANKGLLVPDELTIRVFRHHVDAGIKAGEIDLVSKLTPGQVERSWEYWLARLAGSP